MYLSTPMPEIGLPRRSFSEGGNPVLELHQPLRLCRPPPELLGQRDEMKSRRKFFASARGNYSPYFSAYRSLMILPDNRPLSKKIERASSNGRITIPSAGLPEA